MIEKSASVNGAADGCRSAAAQDESSDDSARAGLFETATRAGIQTAEIFSHVSTLLEVRADRLRSALQRKVFQLAAGTLVLVGLAAAIGAASVRVVAGTAGALTTLCDGRTWAGDLIGGALILALALASCALSWGMHTRKQFKKVEAKYAERRRRHTERFGGKPAPASAPAAD